MPDASAVSSGRTPHRAGPDAARQSGATHGSTHRALVGFRSGGGPPLDPRLIFGVAATVRALAVGSHAQFAQLMDFIAAQQLRPVVDRVFPFDQAGEAFRYYEKANPFGKVVIEVG